LPGSRPTTACRANSGMRSPTVSMSLSVLGLVGGGHRRDGRKMPRGT
jgi:hypothetical protein